MDLFIGALFVLAIVLALFLIFKRIFNRKKGKVDSSQEISSKEVLGKEVSNMEDEARNGEEKSEDRG
ncbi:hypothetical protein SAMN04488057_103193 [Cyclobacterium lianum]|uniref:Uncharacterized protein n=1 Tax=Cyclobacterium lianum TaxID=388280 RepID=A0A1M7LA43_9BACT|nr:hypothetical protein [Cyclobacterium lianum]SHM74931.1 hypothetical protein SAMN04488057_103193 [Cyclobacterium lianum]